MSMATLKFEPWPVSSISTLFWKTLADKKLNEFQKGRVELTINAFYVQNFSKNSQLFFSTESFEAEVSSVAELGSNFRELKGLLLLCDTIEEFKGLDRAAEASKVAERNLNSNEIYHFVVFSFADVKRFKFYHQIAYPVQLFSSEQITWTPSEHSPVDIVTNISIFEVDLENRFIIFNDSSIVPNVPGWPLRQLLVPLSQKFPGEEFAITCVRANEQSFTLKVKLPQNNSLSGLTGWEKSPSDPSKIAPVRVTDISALIDPIQLAKQASELNLKLMKWRLVPDLDLDIVSRTSCLLVGSGTLGCNILRILLVNSVTILCSFFKKISLFRVGDSRRSV